MEKPEFVIIRGLPGSGKSTLAKKFTGFNHVENDMFWGPSYNFDITKVKDADDWCFNMVKDLLEAGNNVVVSNTFVSCEDLGRYLCLANKLDISPTIIITQGNYKSIHDVPEAIVEKMRKYFCYEIDDLLTKILKGEYDGSSF